MTNVTIKVRKFAIKNKKICKKNVYRLILHKIYSISRKVLEKLNRKLHILLLVKFIIKRTFHIEGVYWIRKLCNTRKIYLRYINCLLNVKNLVACQKLFHFYSFFSFIFVYRSSKSIIFNANILPVGLGLESFSKLRAFFANNSFGKLKNCVGLCFF